MSGPPVVGDHLPELIVDVTRADVAGGAAAARVWQPVHHDPAYALDRYGAPDIFLATPTVAAWLERFVTDWSGPRARIGRLSFRMRHPVHAGDRMVFSGRVTSVAVDDAAVTWAEVDLLVTVTDPRTGVARHCCTGRARVAVPATPDDNPWSRRAADWRP